MTHLIPRLAIALGLVFGGAWWAHAQSATDQLHALDQTTYSGRLQVFVDRHAPPGKDGKTSAAERYPAELLFERPDRFRLTLRPGTKSEFRAVAEAGVLRWQDLGSGFSGKASVDEVTDPLALALLGTAGELKRFASTRDIPVGKDSDLVGARIKPGPMGNGIIDGTAWFNRKGDPLGFEFHFDDGSRVFVSVMQFEQNVQTSPEDFRL
jgi:hypothetical protein